MGKVLGEYVSCTFMSDVHDYGCGEVHDFLTIEASAFGTRRLAGYFDWIITNPPFGKKSVPFVLRALDLAKVGVAMFMRSQWIVEGGHVCKRYPQIFRDNPPTLIAFFVERVPICMGRWDPDGSTATAYCWLVWLHGARRRPPYWIPPGQRKKLTKPDDRKRFAK